MHPAYCDPSMIRGVFSYDWEISDIFVSISEGEQIEIIVTRLSKDAVPDLFAQVPDHRGLYFNKCESRYNNNVVTITYVFYCTHEFYETKIAHIAKENFDKRFHKDFEGRQG